VELRHYLDIVKRHKWLIVGAALTVALLAGILASLQTPMYRSSARILLRPNDASEQLYPGYAASVYSDPDRYAAGQIDIIHSEAVAKEAAKSLDNADPESLLGEVSAAQDGTSDILSITGYSIDPTRARDVANAFAKAYIENRRQFAVASLQKASEEIEAKLAELERNIAEYDARIGDGGLQSGAGSQLEKPAGSGVAAPNNPSASDQPAGTGLNRGAQPTSDEALKAARYAAATQYQSLFFKLQEVKVDMSLKRGEAELVAEAKTPFSPYSPKPMRSAVLGGFVGLLLGLGIAFLREQLDDRIRSREDAERANGLPVLVEIPNDDQAGKQPDRLAVASDPRGHLAESVRSLRTNLDFIGVDQPIKRIVVTSPGPGDGKSMVAANLAAMYAQAGYKTILVSSDLRRPRLEAMFGIERRMPGLPEVITQTGPVPANGNGNGNGADSKRSARWALLATDIPGLFVLPAGTPPPNPAELLGSRRMDEVLEDLSDAADMVILDTPPLLAVTDAAVVAPKVDAVLIVNALNETRRGAAQRARETIENSGVRITGLVLNKVDPTSGSYYGYYGYYGETEERPKRRLGRRKTPETAGVR
jgi:polysaccharide biosynthesis transport protein